MTGTSLRIAPSLDRPAPWTASVGPGTLATLLHVEDDPNDAMLLSLAFRKAHVPVLIQQVADGQQAVHYLSGTALYADRLRFPFPGMVLLDLKLPVIDGFEVLAWARGQPGMMRLRICVLTSSDQPEDISRAMSLGADQYLVKTCGYAEVIRVVQEHLGPPARTATNLAC